MEYLWPHLSNTLKCYSQNFLFQEHVLIVWILFISISNNFTYFCAKEHSKDENTQVTLSEVTLLPQAVSLPVDVKESLYSPDAASP